MTYSEEAEIDRLLRALHAGTEFAQLISLHRRAAAISKTTGARRFHLTHAWVFSLVLGNEGQIAALETDLRKLGGL